jgi:hypothetical protein
LENSPSKVAASEKPFSHFISADTVVSAESEACAAPFMTKCARQRLERCRDAEIRIEVVRGTAA